MTSLPPQDPLAALWQSTPEPDTHHIFEDVLRLSRLQKRIGQSVLAILCGVAALLIFEEATGRVQSHGMLSIVWILSLLCGNLWRRRSRRNRSEVSTLDTVSLLKVMIGRAKTDLFLARCLYAGVPCGALLGYWLIRAAGLGAPAAPFAVQTSLQLVQTGLGAAALILMTLTGAILNRSRRVQVRELEQKLRCIEEEL